MDEESASALAHFVAEAEGLPESAVQVTRFHSLGGGASRLLRRVDLEIEAPGQAPRALELVMRQDPPGRVVPGGMELEFQLLQAAAEAGVRVPRVHWCSPDGGALKSPFFLMERVAGEAIARRLLRNESYARAREVMTEQLAEDLVRIHGISLDAPGLAALSRPQEGRSAVAEEVERLDGGLRTLSIEPHPVLELCLRWLRERLADVPVRPLRLVHGDFRIGNVLFDESGTRAVLDWELSHAGDPVEDLAWYCVRAWRFGNDDLQAGGLATREQWVAAYEAAGGEAVDRDALRFWEVCGNLKLALVFITQARAFLDGVHRTVELASLGRRIAEPEDELLRLMEGEG